MLNNNLSLPPGKDRTAESGAFQRFGSVDHRVTDVFSNYTTWLENAALSHHTKRTYRSQVNEFVGFLASRNLALEAVSTNPQAILDTYRESLVSRHMRSRKSVNTKLKSVASFLRFAGVEAAIPVMPVYDDGQKKTLTAEEENRVLSVCARSESARHRLLVLLFLRAGLKLAEALGLRVHDIKSENGITTLEIGNSKRGKRKIQVGTDVEYVLAEWLTERMSAGAVAADAHVFTSNSGEPMSAATADFVIRRIGWRSGVVLSAQVLRNTCIGRLWTNSNDATQVALYVGLRSPELVKRHGHWAPH